VTPFFWVVYTTPLTGGALFRTGSVTQQHPNNFRLAEALSSYMALYMPVPNTFSYLGRTLGELEQPVKSPRVTSPRTVDPMKYLALRQYWQRDWRWVCETLAE